MKPTIRFPEFKDLWNNHKIEDMFDRVGTPVDLDDTQTYREIGIRSHGKGIFHKDETTASEIGNKRVFWVEPNCFVVNITTFTHCKISFLNNYFRTFVLYVLYHNKHLKCCNLQ